MKLTYKSSALIRCGLALLLSWSRLEGASHSQADTAGDPLSPGVFVGSTPNSDHISRWLNIPGDLELPVRWELKLYQATNSGSRAGYKLRCSYLASGKTGKPAQVEKIGTWKSTKGTKFNPNAMALELDGLVALSKVDENLLHVLDADRHLMVGDGGYSFTLNRVTAAEKPEPPPPANAPSVSYQLSPLSTGPTVLGVFEGRTPCTGIARELKHDLDAHRMKAKWRVTLFQNPEAKSPTTYKVEGSFYRGALREGSWSIIRGTELDPTATVYRLAPDEGEEALLLLKGDDNVLFFLDQKYKPLIGHADFSYTLNRKASSPVRDKAQR